MAAVDTFASNQAGLSNPIEHLETVTPHDTTTLANVSRALYVGTGGDVTVLTKGGETKTLTAVPSGTWLPIRVQRVNTTGTTASNMLSGY